MTKILTLIFIISQPNFAKAVTALEKLGELKKESCIDVRHLRWSITQKISNKEYLMAGDGIASRGLAILKTKKASYNNTGIPVGIGFKKIGNRTISTLNGFDKNASIWEECSYNPKLECAPLPRNMNLSRPNRTKGDHCNER